MSKAALVLGALLLTSCAKTSEQRVNTDACDTVDKLLEMPRPASEKATLEAVKAACDAEKALHDARDAG